MKHYTVYVTPEAEASIRADADFIHAESPGNAGNWLRGLRKAVESLQTMPQRCPFARENDHFETELRQFVFKHHRIVFSVEGSMVHVHAVRHTSMHILYRIQNVEIKLKQDPDEGLETPR